MGNFVSKSLEGKPNFALYIYRETELEGWEVITPLRFKIICA
jgi:hypothetical protein